MASSFTALAIIRSGAPPVIEVPSLQSLANPPPALYMMTVIAI
jgi:hypothetical protein